MTNVKNNELIKLEETLAIYEETKRGYEELIEKYIVNKEIMMKPYRYKGEDRERPMKPDEMAIMVDHIKERYKEITEEIENIKAKINAA